MDSEELKKRTRDFAHRCVKLAMALPDTPIGRHVRSQLIRCGTSVGANYRAVCLAQSKTDFAFKVSIVAEEADESAFWLEFIICEKLAAPLLKEAEELTKIFIKSRKTVKNRESEFVCQA
jgi:four helix bundle protein